MALFSTAIGACGIAWGPNGLSGLQLPESDESGTMARLGRRFPALAFTPPPPWVEQTIALLRDFLDGAGGNLDAVLLDFSGIGAFEAAVYRAAREIPAGQTMTYGDLAQRIGDVRQARAVGQALGRNPWPIVIPCHRITAAAGRTGGFSAAGGRATKLRLLEIEGALAVERLPLFSPAAEDQGSRR